MSTVFASITWWSCWREDRMIMVPPRTTDYLTETPVPRHGEPPFKLFFFMGKCDSQTNIGHCCCLWLLYRISR